ncbi:MAG TPA: hypothetical protein VIY48_03820 [Candidatus Paceibacterota bacterium]
MSTLFPGANDSFSEPSAPASTPLNNAGGSGRDHDVSHRDLGDAIMAMQAEATLLVHTHDGATARHGSKLTQANTHQSVDTDSGATAIHHTIGTGANQGAAGNHTHTVGNVWPVGSVFITEVAGNPASAPHSLPGTWTAITGTFIVAAGSTFTAGATGGSTSHTHTATFNSTGGHNHTSPFTSTDGFHAHINSDTGAATFGHDHGGSNYNTNGSDDVISPGNGAAYVTYNSSHNHSSGLSNTTYHAHSVGSTDGQGSHFHGVADCNSTANHNHTSTINSAANINLPSYLVVYMWNRTA